MANDYTRDDPDRPERDLHCHEGTKRQKKRRARHASCPGHQIQLDSLLNTMQTL